jgi:hypothetical protein
MRIDQGETYQWRKGIPRQKGDREANPREKEHATVLVQRVQDRDGKCFVAGWVSIRVLHEDFEHGERHLNGTRSGARERSDL